MSFESEDLTFDVESNEDDTEIALVVRSPGGRKIIQHEFIMLLECYLNEVCQAEIYRAQNNSPTH
jgi:hypothetical protein